MTWLGKCIVYFCVCCGIVLLTTGVVAAVLTTVKYAIKICA